jgi:hypothetical protein
VAIAQASRPTIVAKIAVAKMRLRTMAVIMGLLFVVWPIDPSSDTTRDLPVRG